jgi:PleD family two-component response regulator
LILDQKIPHQGSEISEFITVSIGVGTIMPTRQDKVSDFIAEVDKSLYKAKFNGRNMTMVNA